MENFIKKSLNKNKILGKTPYGRSANVNNGTTFNAQPLYVKIRRDIQSQFVITDLKIILPGKGEEEPMGYTRLNENLNRGMVGSDVFICYKVWGLCHNYSYDTDFKKLFNKWHIF